MFLGSYYTKCLLNDLQGKPYSKTKVLITDIIQKIILTLIVLFLLISCDPIKPDYVDKNGKEYLFMSHCVKSHIKTEWGYHYGYNFMNAKYEWHNGMYDETICDSSAIDTIQINKDKKFYAKK